MLETIENATNDLMDAVSVKRGLIFTAGLVCVVVFASLFFCCYTQMTKDGWIYKATGIVGVIGCCIAALCALSVIVDMWRDVPNKSDY